MPRHEQRLRVSIVMPLFIVFCLLSRLHHNFSLVTGFCSLVQDIDREGKVSPHIWTRGDAHTHKTLVQRSSILTVLNIFTVTFFVTASARGQ
jgi:hypothetical protein